jgi:hypothetical protein
LAFTLESAQAKPQSLALVADQFWGDGTEFGGLSGFSVLAGFSDTGVSLGFIGFGAELDAFALVAVEAFWLNVPTAVKA